MSNDTSKLTPMQFHVTQENGTEPPYENEYYEFFEEGIYVDIVSSEVLFSSKHKFPSPCGWPAFFDSIEKQNIIELPDDTFGRRRIEVRSKNGNSHLGHVFTDGPAPTGIRYCINSAAIKFIPKADLAKHGLEKYE